MKAIAICGSPRKKGNTEILLRRCGQQLEAAGIETEFVALRDKTVAPFWLAVRENINSLHDARAWWAVCKEPIEPVIEDGAFLAEAAALLPSEPWGEGTWKSWTMAVKDKTGRKGKGLFHPIRLALTARGDGPALANLLPVIGRERAHARLMGNAA